MKKVNVEPTAEVMDKMAVMMRDAAKQLEHTAFRMRETGDITYAAEALGIVTNSMNSLRLDLLITRPLRETLKS